MPDKDLRIEVGKRLQEVRAGRDQRTFAEAVDSVQQTISKYERGEIPRSWLFLARLRDDEGVDLNRLLTRRSNGPEGQSLAPESSPSRERTLRVETGGGMEPDRNTARRAEWA